MLVKKFVIRNDGMNEAQDFIRLLLNFIHGASPVRSVLFAASPEMASLLGAEGFDIAFGRTGRGFAVKCAGEDAAVERLVHNLELASLSGVCEAIIED